MPHTTNTVTTAVMKKTVSTAKLMVSMFTKMGLFARVKSPAAVMKIRQMKRKKVMMRIKYRMKKRWVQLI